ncbi:hypothetical protein [Dictyobacter arantiisoli]|uniref:IPT/TIG domain-containing protein n=1 Tax=Dictyobacter arantiisoli TaxID=2014874 RepID=A0A5A5T6N8_9CHLR|nr:hypothetical protein [Dictyobacter arantiisoli]GCF06895.1 hypothetical protein KDI_04590 [Dictyobacter arantiisoli]
MPQAVLAALHPSIIVNSTAIKLDAQRCVSVLVKGQNFSSTTTKTSFASLSAHDPADKKLPVTPDRVALSSHGTFAQIVKICDLLPLPFEHTVLTATDTLTGIKIKSTTLEIAVPEPAIAATPLKVQLFNGCATITLTGTHFIPSNITVNYAIIYGIHAKTLQQLQLSPHKINVLGGGNIAYSAQFCGLSKHQKFVIIASDSAGDRFSAAQPIETI